MNYLANDSMPLGHTSFRAILSTAAAGAGGTKTAQHPHGIQIPRPSLKHREAPIESQREVTYRTMEISIEPLTKQK